MNNIPYSFRRFFNLVSFKNFDFNKNVSVETSGKLINEY